MNHPIFHLRLVDLGQSFSPRKVRTSWAHLRLRASLPPGLALELFWVLSLGCREKELGCSTSEVSRLERWL